FELITSSFKEKITQWDYFVNWEKVLANIEPLEKELNLLNSLIGKENIEKEAYALIKEYPQVIKAFPTLIAIRENSIDVLIDSKKFIYQNYSFQNRQLKDAEIKELARFVKLSGIGKLLQDRKIKNL